MSGRKYVWRVEGEWAPADQIDEGYPPTNKVRHYLTKAAAEHKAAQWLAGAEYEDREPETNAPVVHVVPPALRVSVRRSEPIVWAEEMGGWVR